MKKHRSFKKVIAGIASVAMLATMAPVNLVVPKVSAATINDYNGSGNFDWITDVEDSKDVTAKLTIKSTGYDDLVITVTNDGAYNVVDGENGYVFEDTINKDEDGDPKPDNVDVNINELAGEIHGKISTVCVNNDSVTYKAVVKVGDKIYRGQVTAKRDNKAVLSGHVIDESTKTTSQAPECVYDSYTCKYCGTAMIDEDGNVITENSEVKHHNIDETDVECVWDYTNTDDPICVVKYACDNGHTEQVRIQYSEYKALCDQEETPEGLEIIDNKKYMKDANLNYIRMEPITNSSTCTNDGDASYKVFFMLHLKGEEYSEDNYTPVGTGSVIYAVDMTGHKAAEDSEVDAVEAECGKAGNKAFYICENKCDDDNKVQFIVGEDEDEVSIDSDLVMVDAETGLNEYKYDSGVKFKVEGQDTDYNYFVEDGCAYLIEEVDDESEEPEPIKVVLKEAFIPALVHTPVVDDDEEYPTPVVTKAVNYCGRYESYAFYECANGDHYVILDEEDEIKIVIDAEDAEFDDEGILIQAYVDPEQELVDHSWGDWDDEEDSNGLPVHSRKCSVCNEEEVHYPAGEYLATSAGHIVFSKDDECTEDGCELELVSLSEALNSGNLYPHNWINENANMLVCDDCGYTVVNENATISVGEPTISIGTMYDTDSKKDIETFKQTYNFAIAKNGMEIVSYGAVWSKTGTVDEEKITVDGETGVLNAEGYETTSRTTIKNSGTYKFSANAESADEAISVVGYVIYKDSEGNFDITTAATDTLSFNDIAEAEMENNCSISVTTDKDIKKGDKKGIFKFNMQTEEGFKIVNYEAFFIKAEDTIGITDKDEFISKANPGGKKTAITANGVYTVTIGKDANITPTNVAAMCVMTVEDSYGNTYTLATDPIELDGIQEIEDTQKN